MSFETSCKKLELDAYADCTDEFKSILIDKGMAHFTKEIGKAFYFRSKKTFRSLAISTNPKRKCWMISAEKQRSATKGEIREIEKLCTGKFHITRPGAKQIATLRKNRYHIILWED